MRKIKIGITALLLISLSSCDIQSQNAIGGILKQIPIGGTPTQFEIGQGLKQALEIGTSKGADQLALKDGFLGNYAVKILFPTEAQKVESTLRSIGLNSLADNVILSLNRAAEDAAKEAKASTPLTEKATELYRQICSAGLNKKDFSVIFKYLNEQ